MAVVSTLRQIAEDTWQSPSMMLDRLGLDPDEDIDRPLGLIETDFYVNCVHILDGLKP